MEDYKKECQDNKIELLWKMVNELNIKIDKLENKPDMLKVQREKLDKFNEDERRKLKQREKEDNEATKKYKEEQDKFKLNHPKGTYPDCKCCKGFCYLCQCNGKQTEIYNFATIALQKTNTLIYYVLNKMNKGDKLENLKYSGLSICDECYKIFSKETSTCRFYLSKECKNKRDLWRDNDYDKKHAPLLINDSGANWFKQRCGKCEEYINKLCDDKVVTI